MRFHTILLACSLCAFSSTALSPAAFATPGDMLVGAGTAVYDFEGGGNLSAAVPFASNLSGDITGLCAGPGNHIYAATSASLIFDITAGGSFAAATPFATLPDNYAMALACDGAHVRAFIQDGRVLEATAGGNVSAVPFAFNISNGTSITYGINGHLFAVRYDGTMDINAGGSMAAQPLYASLGGMFDFLFAGAADATHMYAAGYMGNVYDVSAQGMLGTPHATGLGQVTSLLKTPSALFAWRYDTQAMYDVTAGGDMSLATPYATNIPGASIAPMIYVPGCGDGYVTAGETCDGDGAGTSGQTAQCDSDCSAADCGDAVLNTTAGETCDPGGETASCDDDCTASACGDAVLNTTAGEICDGGGETATCDDDCTAPVCGDGTLNTSAGEACDDNNTVDGDGCDASCEEESTGPGGGSEGGSGGAGGSEGGSGGSGAMSEGGSGAMSEGGSAAGGSGADVCVPGQQLECACPGGAPGAQACADDGSSFLACECPANALDGDSGCSITAETPARLPQRALAILAVGALAFVRRRRARR